MESISHLLTALKAFLILVGILYAFLGQPLMVLNELRKDSGIEFRGLWFIGTLILGPFVTVPFGMFFTENAWLKKASQVAGVILLIVTVLYLKFGAGLGLADTSGPL